MLLQVDEPIFLSPHKVPNIMLAKFNTHRTVQVFFPGLYKSDRGRRAVLEEKKKWLFYEDGLKHSMASWPGEYNNLI